MPNFVAGKGKSNAKIMFVGEAPGRIEDETGFPFSGPSGEFLDSCLSDIDQPEWRDECYITNIFKYRPPGNNIRRIQEVCNVSQQLELLEKEINLIKPNVIVALGGIALEYLTGQKGIYKWRGSIIPSKWGLPKVIPTLHPANFIRETDDYRYEVIEYIYRAVMLNDLRRAFDESKNPNLDLPHRNIRIVNDAHSLFKFVRDNRGRGEVWADIETFGSTLPVCISLAFDRYSAISIPLVRRIRANVKKGKKIYKVTHTICERTDSESAAIYRELDELFRTIDTNGQNFKFDSEKLSLVGFKFKRIKSDTVIKSHVINPEYPERTLNFLGSVYTREPYYKEEGKEFVYGKDPIERLLSYNARDSVVDCEIDEEMELELEELSDIHHVDMKAFYYNYQMRLYPLYREMEKIGFRIDEVQSALLEEKYTNRLERTVKRLEEILQHDFNPNSWQQVAKALYTELGLPFRGYRGQPGTDEKTLTSLLANNAKNDKQKESINLILDAKKERKTIGTYIKFKRDYDGRGRSTYNQVGAETGRSTSRKLRPPLRPYKIGFASQTLTKHGNIGADIRSQFISEEGFVFVGVDKAQAEARVVAVLSKDWKFYNAMDKIDTHRRTAALVLGYTSHFNLEESCPEADRIEKEGGERFIGKKVRHAGNYDMQKKEAMQQINKEAKRLGINLNISEWKAGKMLELFHHACPNIRGVFHRDIKYAIDNGRTLVNPFGRVRTFHERYNEQLYKGAYAHLPQSIVKDDVGNSMIRIDEWRKSTKAPIKIVADYYPGFAFQGEGHDSLLFQMPENEYMDICKEIKPLLTYPIDFNQCTLNRDFKLVIPVDFEVGTNYNELSKFKVQ